MDTGVYDLEVAFFKANFTWFNDICSKDLSIRPIYAVLNTHNLDMILKLKYKMNFEGFTQNGCYGNTLEPFEVMFYSIDANTS